VRVSAEYYTENPAYRISLHKLGPNGIIPRYAGNLERDLKEGSGEVVDQNDLAESRLQD
jgi:hypothetical protein